MSANHVVNNQRFQHSFSSHGNFRGRFSSNTSRKKNNFNPDSRAKKPNKFSNANTNRLTQTNTRNRLNFKPNNFNSNTNRKHNNFGTNTLRRKPTNISKNILPITKRPFAHRTYTSQQQSQAFRTLAVCKDTKTLALIKEYEILYKIPLLSYMYDIMCSVRLSHNIQNESIRLLLPILPCNGGIFTNVTRLKQSKNGTQHFLSPNTLSLSSETRDMLMASGQEYGDTFQPIPSPKQIQYKVDGIWETDVKIIRAFNKYLHHSGAIKFEDKYDPLFDGNTQCEYHLRIWSNGLVKQQLQNEEKQMCLQYDSDSSSDDEYGKHICSAFAQKKSGGNNTFYGCEIGNDIDISKVMEQNMKKLDIRTCQRKIIPNKSEEKLDNSNDCTDMDSGYETLDAFVARVCKDVAVAAFGEAIMIVIDTRNDPNISVYVWRKPIANFEKMQNNVCIGDNRKKSKKQKYFNLRYNGRVISVGQYIGLSTFFLGKYIHQFWSIFGREIRFEPVHARELWPEFYDNQTLFEVKTDFEGKYAEKDEKEQERYREFYGKELIDKLNDAKSKFGYHQITEMEEKYNRRLEDGGDEDGPDISDYGPYVYHKARAGIVWDLKNDLKYAYRDPIQDFTPKQYKVVYAHARAQRFEDVPAEFETGGNNEEDDV